MMKKLFIAALFVSAVMCKPQGNGSSAENRKGPESEPERYDTLVTSGTLVRTSCADPS